MKLSVAQTLLASPMNYRSSALRLVALFLLSVSAYCQGQGTFEPILITFDGPPYQAPGSGSIVQQYFESGMAFTPIDPDAPGAGFDRWGAPTDPRDPDNGTAYVRASLGSTLKFSSVGGSVFNLVSVDLAEYSTVVPDAVTVPFIGYRSDGSTVSVNFTTDGIIDGTGPLADFQTFYFGPEFSGLTRVEIPDYGWSLDNLVVSVPEPSSGILLLVGGWAFVALKLRYRRREN